MKRISALFAMFVLALAFGACKKAESGDQGSAKVDEAQADVGEVTIAQLDALISKGSAAIFDANADHVRKEYGKIPGATLLSSSSGYDLSKLPEDKSSKLVFYCANRQCGASHASARKALAAGYSDVNVLPDGIMGWKKAGKPTEKAM